MKINEIVNEDAPPQQSGKAINIDDMSPEELQAHIDQLEIDDTGIEPVVVVPAAAALRKLGLLKKGVDVITDLVRKRGKAPDRSKPPKDTKRKDSKSKDKQRDKDFDGIGPDASFSDYEFDPDAGVKASEWYKKNQGGAVKR